MNIPARLIRAVVQDIPGLRPELTVRQERTRDLILRAAIDTFAALGRKGVTMRALAKGIWISRERIELHFLDVDCLLAEILLIHLRGIARALGNAPDTDRDRRAAYYAYTRGPSGAPTREHALFISERQHLPPDLLPDIEHHHSRLGDTLCPEDHEGVLAMLDDPAVELGELEFVLAEDFVTTGSQPQRYLATATDAELEAQAQQARQHAPEAPAPEAPALRDPALQDPALQDPALQDPALQAGPPVPRPDPPHAPAPSAATIRQVLSPARPVFSRPPRPPRSMASLLQPPEDPPGPVPILHQARAAPSTA